MPLPRPERQPASGLHVGHVDEVFSFVPVDSPRGWALVMNDPALARDLLQQVADAGHGSALLFAGLRWADDVRAGLLPRTARPRLDRARCW